MPRGSIAKKDEALNVLQMIWYGAIKPLVYAIMLGIPANYRRRLGRAEWIQWASSRRWTDQQKAMDGFLKSLVDEWNIIILLSTLFLSASVGFLTVGNIGRIAEATVLISLIFSLSGIILSVVLVWRYQRQLSNNYDMQAVMDEFIYDADEEILPIFLGLPVSFLVWSVIFFSVGVVSYSWTKLPNIESPIGVTAALAATTVISFIVWFLHRYLWMFKRKINFIERLSQLKKVNVSGAFGGASGESIPMLVTDDVDKRSK
ncbi:hypothetical protein FRC02_007794 [Tulasnella sp. 418]|nr:hypothetical protein FRC02_007794 [Tulasnella sp. 418]